MNRETQARTEHIELLKVAQLAAPAIPEARK